MIGSMTTPSKPLGGRGGRAKRPTATDVARRAGVSQATVSYVLNNTPHQVIPEPTRERVLAAAVELGYTPSAAARMLVSGRSDVVLLLLPDWPIGLGVASLLDELSQAFARHDLTFVIHPRVQGRPVAELWKSVTPAAVLAYETFDEADLTAITRSGAELVRVSALQGEDFEQSVARTGRLQVEHLAAAGHHRLGYAWPDDDRVQFFARHRLEGVRAACEDLGLPAPVVSTVPLTVEAAADVIGQWQDGSEPVTGVCAFNDEVALALLGGARQSGVEVPGELAVVGVDDLPFAALVAPALTTVARDTPASARDIVDTVLARLDGRQPAHDVDRTDGDRTDGDRTDGQHVIVRGSA
jgi:DNA-binding LacI/PurR family transcriptional regulator